MGSNPALILGWIKQGAVHQNLLTSKGLGDFFYVGGIVTSNITIQICYW
jgi:hypothetical protein